MKLETLQVALAAINASSFKGELVEKAVEAKTELRLAIDKMQEQQVKELDLLHKPKEDKKK